jgi:RimJ/RimL family protein N-acetyltransferase
MLEDILTNQRSFSQQINRTDSHQHLNSHCRLICELMQFLEPFHFPLFPDKFMGMLRFHCFNKYGAKSSIEEIKISFQIPDKFYVEMVCSNSKEKFFEEYFYTIADILAYPISSEPVLKTERLEIGLLLPSDEPEIIDFIQDPDVWKMRGERYSPLVNIHSVYNHDQDHQLPWYKYYFVVRMRESKQVIGFIGFYQISQPSFFGPIINQTPYQNVMLSYALSKQYWGKGLMFESLSACVPWFMSSQNVNSLIAFAEINNLGSRRILQKLGLQEYGILENSMISADLKDIYKFMIYKN